MKPLAKTVAVACLLLAGPGVRAQEVRERPTFRGYTFPVQKAVLSPDGKLLASGCGGPRGGELKLWDAATGKEVGAFPGYSGSLYVLTFSADGKRLISGNDRGTVQLWDVVTRKEITTFNAHMDHNQVVALSPDGKRLAWAGRKDVKLWDVTGGKELASFRRTVEAWGMAFSPDLTLLASPNYPEVDLWDVAGGKEPRVLSEHRGAVGCVAFTADSKTLVAASSWNKGDFRYQGQVKLWDVATGREKATLKGDFGYIWALAISPDSKVLAAVQSRGDLGEDGVMEVVDVACGRKLVSQTWKAGSVPSLTFRADGTLFVTATTGNTIKLWEVTPHGQGKNAGAAR